MQVTFWEPLNVNSAVVTKYKGKDRGPHTSTGDMHTWQEPQVCWGILWDAHPRHAMPAGQGCWQCCQATFVLKCRRSQGCTLLDSSATTQTL